MSYSRIWCVFRCTAGIAPSSCRAGTRSASAGKLTLKKLAEYPIVTYVFSFSGRSSLPALFETAGLSLDVALTARDSDVIKTYVRIGLGRRHPGETRDRSGRRLGSRRARCRASVRGAHHLDRLPAQRAAARLHVRVHRVAGAAPAAQARARDEKGPKPRKMSGARSERLLCRCASERPLATFWRKNDFAKEAASGGRAWQIAGLTTGQV